MSFDAHQICVDHARTLAVPEYLSRGVHNSKESVVWIAWVWWLHDEAHGIKDVLGVPGPPPEPEDVWDTLALLCLEEFDAELRKAPPIGL